MKPSKDFYLDYKTHSIRKYVDGLDEIKQNDKLALVVPRLTYLIYSENYGSELNKLIGKDYDYVLGRIRSVIRECLLVDDRVLDVDEFELTQKGEMLLVQFKVHTIYGDFTDGTELKINGL